MSSIDLYPAFVRSRTKYLGNEALDLHHATTGMSGEAGEALDITKKIWIYNQTLETVNKSGVTHRTHLIEEAGDMLFYIQALCNHLGVSLEHLVTINMDKLERRYPTGYSDQAALERADKAGQE